MFNVKTNYVTTFDSKSKQIQNQQKEFATKTNPQLIQHTRTRMAI